MTRIEDVNAVSQVQRREPAPVWGLCVVDFHSHRRKRFLRVCKWPLRAAADASAPRPERDAVARNIGDAIASGVSIESELLGAFEDHSPNAIRRLFGAGASPTELIDGKRPIDCLIEMYPRTHRFPECMQVMLDAGATTGDPLLEAILLDDDSALRRLLAQSAEELHRKLRFVSAFTSCWRVTALHVCADFNSVRCARVLLETGADVNARADQTAEGIGGQTPIFHAVNSIFNHCRPMMELLVDAGADLDLRVTALLWGESMSWETVVYDVTPVSYAQCGLYRQFHRQEEHVYSNIEYLFTKRYGTAPPIRNVPNRYLVEGH